MHTRKEEERTNIQYTQANNKSTQKVCENNGILLIFVMLEPYMRNSLFTNKKEDFVLQSVYRRRLIVS